MEPRKPRTGGHAETKAPQTIIKLALMGGTPVPLTSVQPQQKAGSRWAYPVINTTVVESFRLAPSNEIKQIK
jgi:hypothetical protein